jgi:hypothetical protein
MRFVFLILSVFALLSFVPEEMSAQEPSSNGQDWMSTLSDAWLNKGVMSGNPGVVAEAEIAKFLARAGTGMFVPDETAWLIEKISSLTGVLNEEWSFRLDDEKPDGNHFNAVLSLMQNLTVWDSYTEMGKPNT